MLHLTLVRDLFPAAQELEVCPKPNKRQGDGPAREPTSRMLRIEANALAGRSEISLAVGDGPEAFIAAVGDCAFWCSAVMASSRSVWLRRGSTSGKHPQHAGERERYDSTPARGLAPQVH